MNDEEIIDMWATLDPAAARLRRIDSRVKAWLEARDTPLASEWIGLLRIAPFQTLGLLTVGAAAVVAASPVVWLARALILR